MFIDVVVFIRFTVLEKQHVHVPQCAQAVEKMTKPISHFRYGTYEP